MDPSTKRSLWNSLCRIRDDGKCLILTTHSMDECEAICTRIGIMVNGAFQCLGSAQYLKNKFSDGYVLVVKLTKSAEPRLSAEYIENVKLFVNTNFPTSELKHGNESLLTYVIKEMRMPWSKIFGIMERGKMIVHGMDDYSVSQFDLEQVS